MNGGPGDELGNPQTLTIHTPWKLYFNWNGNYTLTPVKNEGTFIPHLIFKCSHSYRQYVIKSPEIFYALPTIVGRERDVFGLFGRLSTPIPRDAISLYLLEWFQWNFVQVITMWVGTAEKVKGQRSVSNRIVMVPDLDSRFLSKTKTKTKTETKTCKNGSLYVSRPRLKSRELPSLNGTVESRSEWPKTAYVWSTGYVTGVKWITNIEPNKLLVSNGFSSAEAYISTLWRQGLLLVWSSDQTHEFKVVQQVNSCMPVTQRNDYTL